MAADQERVSRSVASEAIEELLMLHRLKLRFLLRKTVMSTNPIVNLFTLARHRERNIKRPCGSPMLQRWLGMLLLYGEQQFRRVKIFANIAQVIAISGREKVEQQPSS